PVMVAALVRLNKQYEDELHELKQDAPGAAEAPILRRHTVIVLVDQLDAAAARAIQYARALTPDELRAVHFDLDPIKTEDLSTASGRRGSARLRLDIVECADRRTPRAAAELVAAAVADGDTEVTVLVPRRQYTHVWHRLLHDRTADAIAQAISVFPHSNVTIVPYHLGTRGGHEPAPATTNGNGRGRLRRTKSANGSETATAVLAGVDVPDATPIAQLTYRQRARIAGRVRTVRVQPHGGVPSLECTIVDETGGMALLFLGRRSIPGMKVGARVVVEGTVGENHGRLAMLNPTYEFLPDPHP